MTYKFVQNVAVFGTCPPLEVVFKNEEELWTEASVLVVAQAYILHYSYRRLSCTAILLDYVLHW
jgi:hypothetical protein